MKIMLIQPKMNKRPMDTNLKTQMAPSLGLLTVKKITPSEHEVIIVNENIEKINFDEAVDLVGITVTVDVSSRAILIADEFKKRGISTVAGGIHISASANKYIYNFDAICIGMAERVWKKIIQDKINNRLKKFYMDMENMKGSEVFSPDYTSIDYKKYLYTNIITTSRGCPHKCDFCYNSNNVFKYINRPIEDVILDIKTLNTKHIMFIDDNFIGNPSWTYDFLLKIKPLNITWSAAVTMSIIKYPNLLDLMAETGCQSLFIGFESINADSLKSVHKNNNIEEYTNVIEEIHKRGIMINASMVFGLNNDDKDIFQRSLDFLVKNKVETLTSHILTPYPGTALYRSMLKENKITDFDLSHYNTAHVVFKPENMSKEELYRGYLNIYKKFYSFKNILKRFPENKKQWKAYILFNVFYRKFGKFTEILTKIIPMNYLGNLFIKISYKFNKKEENKNRELSVYKY